MMMRPRHYGTLNRSIARGISYAINQNYRPKRKGYTSPTQTQEEINSGIVLIAFIVIVFLLGAIGAVS